MGIIKDYIIESQEKRGHERLAYQLGITYDELIELNHKVETNESNDGLVYSYTIFFDPDAPKEILAKVNGIDKESQVTLLPFDFNEYEYYDEQYELIISNKDYYNSFIQALESAKKLNNVDIDSGGQLTSTLRSQTYIFVIAALEAFLSETFINLTDDNEEYFRNFIETFPDFKETKIELARIFAEKEKIRETAKKVMLDIIYHNLSKVGKMYESTFKITFPKIDELSKCIGVRHDLVHRNGKSKKGDSINIEKDDITDLIKITSNFVEDIARKLQLKGTNV